MVGDTERMASGVSAAGSLVATAWSFGAQAADVLFGLPIQVVLACFFSSAAARTYVGSAGLIRTALTIVSCAAIGAWTLPLALHLFGLPTSLSAGVGVVISGGIQIPEVRNRAIKIVGAIFGRKTEKP